MKDIFPMPKWPTGGGGTMTGVWDVRWRKVRTGALLGAVLFIAGCVGLSKEQVVFNSWATACDAYATTLVALAPSVADGSMSDAGLLVIDDAVALVGPNCRDGAALPNLAGKPTAVIQDILLRLQGLEV
jgi:hypothetical protein